MKKIVLSIVFGLFGLACIAQTNPTVTNPNISPDPIQGSSPVATLEFTFANLGPDAISNLDVDGNPDPIVLKISLQNGTYDDINFANPVAAVGGDYASHFTWTYDAATKTYTGTQNQPISGFDGGTITIGYKATTATTSTTANNGFTVNLTSNSNAPNGPGTNDTNDDNAATVTYVNGPLPVTLVSFSAAKEGTTTHLTWATTSETNSDRFEIERSVDAKSWNKIGTVASHGESSALINYPFTDVKPVNGENLYRLKMIDKDASFAYSRIVSVKFDGSNTAPVSIYPNPSSDKVFLQDADLSQINQVSIYNMSGSNVLSSNTINSNGINVSKLIPGTYVLHVTNLNGSVSNHKIVIAR